MSGSFGTAANRKSDQRVLSIHRMAWTWITMLNTIMNNHTREALETSAGIWSGRGAPESCRVIEDIRIIPTMMIGTVNTTARQVKLHHTFNARAKVMSIEFTKFPLLTLAF
jgi:hypothetical protein